MSYRIAIVAPTLEVPPRNYGGTERVLECLVKALEEMGHTVWVLVHPRSKLLYGKKVTRIPESVDVVHFFEKVGLPSSGEDSVKPWSTPWIYTQHGNAQIGEKLPRNTVFISSNHALRHGGKIFVHNGVDPKAIACRNEARSRGVCFLGRTAWKVKNVGGAIQVARLARIPIQIMGGWRLSLRHDVKWLGRVGQELKGQVLSQSQALINPVRWHEPFGLAIVEAMMAGLPIFGTPYGSLPEIVKAPEFGVLATSARELSQALKDFVHKPKLIRDYAMSEFNVEKMALGYLAHYETVMRGESLNDHEPELQIPQGPETLLPWSEI